MIQFFRSLIFNIVFFSYTTFICFFLVWSLFLSRFVAWKIYNAYFRSVYWLEVLILGLRVKVEGLENLPQDGKYIVASKHQSAHETMILPLLLNDPAIIMKKELMKIPFWGWYAKKAGMIGVDRGGRQKAIASIVEGSKRVFADNRPVIIFPQGTRTKLTDTTLNRPYKGGIAKIYQQLHCPVVPVALNTGVFWGRNSFIKKGGVATFKILPPIPADLPPDEMMKKLEQALEPESAKLVEEAQARLREDEFKNGVADIFGIITLLVALWSGYWLYMAKSVEHVMFDMHAEMQQESPVKISFDNLSTSGYPFKVALTIENLNIHAPHMQVTIPKLVARAFPLPGYPLTIESKTPITLHSASSPSQNEIFTIDYLGMEIAEAVPSLFSSDTALSYYLQSLILKSGHLTLRAFGEIFQAPESFAHNGELIVVLEGYQDYVDDLIEKRLIKRGPAMFFIAMLQNQSAQWLESARKQERRDIPLLTKDAIIIPLTIKDNEIFAGMFKLGMLGEPRPQTASDEGETDDGSLQSKTPPAIQSHPRLPGKPIDIEELMNEQDFEEMQDNSMDSLFKESENLPPSPPSIRNP